MGWIHLSGAADLPPVPDDSSSLVPYALLVKFSLSHWYKSSRADQEEPAGACGLRGCRLRLGGVSAERAGRLQAFEHGPIQLSGTSRRRTARGVARDASADGAEAAPWLAVTCTRCFSVAATRQARARIQFANPENM